MGDLSFSQTDFLEGAKPLEEFTQDGAWEAGAEDFLQTFYDDARQNDFLQLDEAQCRDLARRLWHMGETRKAGQTLVETESLPGLDRVLIGVVMDDQAFLVDSIVAAISRFGVDVHGLFHPIVSGFRSDDGGWVGRGDGTEISESVVGVVIPRQTRRRLQRIEDELHKTLADVAVANADFEAMRDRLESLSAGLRDAHGDTPERDVEEGVAFLDWMREGNFVLLGMRTYDYGVEATPDYADPEVVDGSELGVLRDSTRVVLRQSSEPSVISGNVEAFLRAAPPVSVAKSNLWSRVHRRVRMDFVTVKHFNAGGQVSGETRIVGLLTSEAYSRSVWDIPLIRDKVKRVLETAEVMQGSHKFNRLKYVLGSYPRDELFQIGTDDLERISTSVARAFDRPRTRVFLRRDPFDRFVSVLVYIPREHYSTRARERIGAYLAKAFDGRVSAFYPQYSDAPMARVHFIIGLDADKGRFPSEDEVERHVADIVRPWEAALQARLEAGEDAATPVQAGAADFVRAFPTAYRERFGADEALADIAVLQGLRDDGEVAVRALSLGEGERADFRAKVYRRGAKIEPSNIVPMLENFALHTEEETGFPVRVGGVEYWIHDLDTYVDLPVACDPGAMAAFEQAFLATWNGANTDDGFNRLVLPQAAHWRDVAFLRMCAAYRRQTGMDPLRSVQVEALERHAHITGRLIDLFHARFDPEAFDSRKARNSEVEDRKSVV